MFRPTPHPARRQLAPSVIRTALTIALVLASGCRGPAPLTDEDYDAAAATATESTLSRRLNDLANDSMQGRKPGTVGEERTIAYLEREMRAIGLSPVGGRGFRHPVPLHRLRADGRATFRVGAHVVPLDSNASIVMAVSAGTHVVRDAPLVLVGYGVIAPEHRWDDYGDVDLRGKVALILDGEPDTVRQRRFGTRDARGPHAFYFLKARHALAHGASAAVLIRTGADSVHARRRVALQHTVVGESRDDTREPDVTVHLAASAGEMLARAAGTTLAAWREVAESPTAGPLELPLRLDATVTTQDEPFVSYNVVGAIPGFHPARRGDCVVYLAHWDSFGVGAPVAGDSIYNGALDDAAGVSQMLLVAQMARALPRPPERTMVFVATTAEEMGTRGAQAYAATPACPLARTALAVGMDWSWVWGVTDTLISNGFGYSTVDSLARRVATRLGKAFIPGVGEYWLASDHAVLAMRGVPSWFGGLDGDVIGTPPGWAATQLQSQRSHVPADERKAEWNLAGALVESRFLFELGARAAEGASRLRWTVNSEFRRAGEQLRGTP